MSLLDEIKNANASLVKQRVVTLPQSGKTVGIRGLMLGQINRIGEQKGQGRQVAMQIALTLFDPATGAQLLNPNDLGHLQIADSFSVPDGALIIQVSNELSGIGDKAAELGKASSTEESEPSTSFPIGSVYPSENLETESAVTSS